MTVGLWILGGWLAAATIFVFGCHWGSGNTRELHAALERQAAIIAALQTLVARLGKERDRTFDYARKVEGRLDGDLDDELRRLLDGGGGGS